MGRSAPSHAAGPGCRLPDSTANPLRSAGAGTDNGVIMCFRFSALLFLLVGVLPAQERPIPKPGSEPRMPVRLDALTLEPDIKNKIEAFFSVLKQRKVPEAYTKLLEGSVLAEENPELVTKLVESTTRVLELTGRIDNTEILKIRAAGKTIREVTYLLNGEKRPLRWRFYFYLADGRWQVLDTNVATEASGFFDDPK